MQPPIKVINSKCCLVNSLIVIEYLSDLQKVLSDCANAQADLSLCWSHRLYMIVGNLITRMIC